MQSKFLRVLHLTKLESKFEVNITRRPLRKRDILKSLKDPFNILNNTGIEPFGPLNINLNNNPLFIQKKVLNTIDSFNNKNSNIRVGFIVYIFLICRTDSII